MDFLSRFVKNLSDNLLGTKAVPSVSQVSSDKIIPTEENISDNGTKEAVCENRHSDFPELKMTFSEAQRAGFQFRFIKTRSGHTRKAVIITSIHIKSNKTVIPSYIDGYPVTVIADECKTIASEGISETELFIPETVKFIGTKAFYTSRNRYAKTNCQILFNAVHFCENSCLTIMNNAFGGQEKLKELHFGRYVSVEPVAFSHCTALENVFFNACSICNRAFFGCISLKSASWERIQYCESAVFQNTPFELSHELLIVGDTVQRYNGNSHTVTIPDGAEIISEEAFARCNNLKKVILPSSVKYIRKNAFEYCRSLEHINLDNVTSIADKAFYCCSSLAASCIKLNKDIFLRGNPFMNTPVNTAYMTENGVVIADHLLLPKPPCDKDTWEIPEGIRYIYAGGYKTVKPLKTVIIPRSVSQIDQLHYLFAKRLIIKNPKCCIVCDKFTPLEKSVLKKGFDIFIETESGRYSGFLFRFPVYRYENSTHEAVSDMYSRVLSPTGFDIYAYDEEILSSPLSMRTKLEAAYCRITGGFRLSEMHRKMYMEYVTVHRKKGLEYALKSGDEGQIKFFRGLF